MNASAVLRAGEAGMWGKAEGMLLAQIEETSEPVLYKQLGALYRQMGNLEQAGKAYEKHATLTGCGESLWLSGVLHGRVEERAHSNGIRPMPFCLIDDYLAQEPLALLWEMVETLAPKIEPLPVYWERKDGSTYSEFLDNDRRQSGLQKPEGIEEILKPSLERTLNSLGGELSMPLESIRTMRFSLVFSQDGDHANVHRDDAGRGGLTCVYYLTRTPKPFEGGELLLFDTDNLARSWDTNRFTTVHPVNNRLVVFPSYGYHQVTPIRLKSRDPMDARIAIPVHVRI